MVQNGKRSCSYHIVSNSKREIRMYDMNSSVFYILLMDMSIHMNVAPSRAGRGLGLAHTYHRLSRGSIHGI